MTETTEEMVEAKFQQLDSRGTWRWTRQTEKAKTSIHTGSAQKWMCCTTDGRRPGCLGGTQCRCDCRWGACRALGRETAKPALLA